MRRLQFGVSRVTLILVSARRSATLTGFFFLREAIIFQRNQNERMMLSALVSNSGSAWKSYTPFKNTLDVFWLVKSIFFEERNHHM